MVEIREIARWEGEPVTEAELVSDAARIRVMSWGCAVRDWRVKVGGEWRPVALGFDRFEDYPELSPHFGAVVGRVANRIGGARFRLEGREVRLAANEGAHHLHGGKVGLSRRNWRMERLEDGVRLTWGSPDGEDGYPGAVEFEVTMRLRGARLDYVMTARADRPTPINLAQHNYWNLDGEGTVAGHRLRVEADRLTEVDAGLIPTGRLVEAAGALDFGVARALTGPDGAPLPVDLNYVLREREAGAPAAEVVGGRGDLRLRLWTDQPGLQVYDGIHLRRWGPGPVELAPFAGLCLEAQNFPDAVNRPEFPDPIYGPERMYRQETSIEIAPVA